MESSGLHISRIEHQTIKHLTTNITSGKPKIYRDERSAAEPNPPVFRIRIRIRMFLDLPDLHPDPLATSTDHSDPSLFSQKCCVD
jgi:hypothetical protein